MAEELKGKRVQLAHRRQQLWRYCAQACDLTDDVGANWVLASSAKASIPSDVIVAPDMVEAARSHITATVERLHLVNRQRKNFTSRVGALVDQLAGPESEPGQQAEQGYLAILRSLPQVGRITLATLAEARQAFRARDYHALRNLTDVAPVTKRNGKSRRVEMRQARSNRLRTAVYYWARIATQHYARRWSPCAALRAQEHLHGRPLRTFADRLLGMACVMLKNRTSTIRGTRLLVPNKQLDHWREVSPISSACGYQRQNRCQTHLARHIRALLRQNLNVIQQSFEDVKPA